MLPSLPIDIVHKRQVGKLASGANRHVEQSEDVVFRARHHGQLRDVCAKVTHRTNLAAQHIVCGRLLEVVHRQEHADPAGPWPQG